MSWSCRGEKTGSITITVSTTEEDKYAELDYVITRRDTGKKDSFNYRIPIISTPCHFGGRRYWFECPMSRDGIYCGRRVAKLYQGGDYFACRHCYDLSYASRNETPTYRRYPYRDLNLLKKVDDIEEEMTKRTYKGLPTRKMKRILRIQSKIYNFDANIDDLIYQG